MYTYVSYLDTVKNLRTDSKSFRKIRKNNKNFSLLTLLSGQYCGRYKGFFFNLFVKVAIKCLLIKNLLYLLEKYIPNEMFYDR